MRPLISRKVPRLDTGKTVAEWTPASDHLTDQGRNDFRARMELYRLAAQAKPDNVKQLKRK